MKKHKVFIADFDILLPGIQSKDAFLDTEFDRFQCSFEISEEQNGMQRLQGKPDFSGLEAWYPARSSLKIMREDVLATTIIARRLIQSTPLTPPFRDETALYVANGVFVETSNTRYGQLSSIMSKLKDLDESPEATNQFIFAQLPPLLALETLSNGSESFAAQHTGLKGRNTTYGNTSIAGYYAFKSAFDDLANGHIDFALVCAGNCSKEFSYHTFHSLANKHTKWKESVAACAILLCSEDGLQKIKRKPLAQIREVKNDTTVPGFKKEAFKLHIGAKANTVLYTGAYSEADYHALSRELAGQWERQHSLFPSFGHLGPANILSSICNGIKKMEHREAEQLDCFDTDIYNRQSLITISKA